MTEQNKFYSLGGKVFIMHEGDKPCICYNCQKYNEEQARIREGREKELPESTEWGATD